MSSEEKPKKKLDFVIAREGSKPLLVSSEKLTSAVLKGEIIGEDLIFHESLKVWTKARYVKGVRSLIARLENTDHKKNIASEVEDDELLDENSEDNNEPLKEKDYPRNYAELPPILAAHVTASAPKQVTPPVSSVSQCQVVGEGSIRLPLDAYVDPYPTHKLPTISKVKNFIQYGIIGCFLLMLLYNFYPSYNEGKEFPDFIQGKITLNGEPVRMGSIIVQGSGKETGGTIDAQGNYRLDDPPKGSLKVKVNAFPIYSGFAGELKKNLNEKGQKKKFNPLAKYESYENELKIDYHGGIKIQDLLLETNDHP